MGYIWGAATFKNPSWLFFTVINGRNTSSKGRGFKSHTHTCTHSLRTTGRIPALSACCGTPLSPLMGQGTALWEVNLQLPWSVKSDCFYDLQIKCFSQLSSKLHHAYTQTCSDKSFEIGGSHLPVGDVTDTVSIFYIQSVNLCLTDIRKGVDQPHRGLMHGLRSMAGMTHDRSTVQRKHREARGYFTVHEHPQA